MEKMHRDFFNQPTLRVAEELLGKSLVFGNYQGIITETEAYIGQDDPACHAARGRTPRTEVMFGSPGYSYVYFIYGMYYCFNIVTEYEGFPAAVLIRGLDLLTPTRAIIQGPGKLCRALGITTAHNKIDLVTTPDFFVKDTERQVSFSKTPRIGIRVGTEKLWRFVMDRK